MFVGACAGSTGGGIKVARVVILGKVGLSGRSQRMIHPQCGDLRAAIEGRALDEKTVRGSYLFLTVYLLVFVASCTAAISCEQLRPGDQRLRR